MVPAAAPLLYLWAPLTVVSGLVLLLGPGLVIAHGRGTHHPGTWVLEALAWSTGVLGLATTLLQAGAGASPTGRGFALLVLGLTALAALAVLPRLRRGPPPAPWDTPGGRHALASMAVMTALLVAALAPKFYWESFNGDGAHAYESARLLLHRVVPFWPPEAGGMASYPGLKTFLSSYPVSWCVRLFGEVEASARVPYLLFLVALYGGLIALGDALRTATGTPVQRWLPWLGLTVYTVVMAFSATYSPYHADLALPATEDTLFLAWSAGFALALLQGRVAGVIAFAVLTYTTSPGGLILLGLWCGVGALLLRPVPWRPLIAALLTVAVCLVLERLAPRGLAALALPVPGTEHATGALAERLRNTQWREWRRLAYLVVPGGILPAVALAAWWRQDRVGRVVTLVALAQFAFFYLQARIALHYFVPAMVLPLIVLLRDPLWSGARARAALAGAALAAGVALLLSVPPDPRPQLQSRVVGSSLDDAMPGYAAVEPAALGRSALLKELFPLPSQAGVPDSLYGGSPLEWYYYAHRGAARADAAYRLQPEGDPPPAGGRQVATEGGAALYVLRDSVWAAQRRARTGRGGIAPLFLIPKRVLFQG
jgi:hypothetical protein